MSFVIDTTLLNNSRNNQEPHAAYISSTYKGIYLIAV